MKKTIFSAVIAALALSSCSLGDNNGTSDDLKALTVRLSGSTTSNTRAVGEPGTEIAADIDIDVNKSWIVLINNDNTKRDIIPMEEEAKNGTGQTILSVPATAKVFILANVPAAVKTQLDAAVDMATIQAITGNITAGEVSFMDVPLANENYDAKSITVDATDNTKASVTVRIKPLVARLELVNISTKSTSSITGFDVTGVFLDDFYPSYTLIGGHSGTLHEQGTEKNFTAPFAYTEDINGDFDITWSAVLGVASPDDITTPTTTEVWGYNLPSGKLSRLIIRLENITGVAGISAGDTKYLTVRNYDINDPFKPGEIYRLSNMEFEEAHLSDEPNPGEVDLTVHIEIVKWTVKSLTPELAKP